MNKCQGIMGAIFGHKFSPRFSEGPTNMKSARGCDASDIIKMVKAVKKISYHHDVCERCGVIVEKHNKQEA